MDAPEKTETESSVKVTKHNDLVSASYRLTLAEQRLILAAIAQIDPRKPMPKANSVMAVDYAHIYGITPGQAYEQMQDAAKMLFNSKITSIRGSGKNMGIREIRWVQECEYVKGEGRVELVFSDSVRPYLSRLHTHVTSYDLWRVARLDSAHSFRLFEMLMQFKSTGWVYMRLDELRERLALGESYQRFNNLRQRVIDPAVEELREKAGLNVTVEFIKEGKAVTALRLTFTDADDLQLLRNDRWPSSIQQVLEDAMASEEELEEEASSGEYQDEPHTQDMFG